MEEKREGKSIVKCSFPFWELFVLISNTKPEVHRDDISLENIDNLPHMSEMV